MTFGALVMPFCVRRLRLTEAAGNRVAVVYWTAFSAGRLASVFTGMIDRSSRAPERILTASLAVTLVSSVALIIIGETPTDTSIDLGYRCCIIREKGFGHSNVE